MIKLSAKLITILILLFLPGIANAEISISPKIGYIKYLETRDSEYPGNNVYDSELCYGGYIRYDLNNNLIRLDIDTNKTGDEFYNKFPKPYEGIHLKQTNYIFSIGRKFKLLYALIGCAYTQNEADILRFPPPEPEYEAKVKDSLSPAIILGLQQDITKNLYFYIETRYISSKMPVEVNNEKVFDENTSNASIWTGVAWKF